VAETIRAHFKRRARRALLLCGVGIVVTAIAIAVFASGYVLTGGVVAVVGVAIVSSGLGYLELTRCPRCLSRISATASSTRLPHPINFCPYCGSNLDSDHPSFTG
jgi:uncharacterized membrane protein